MNPLTHPPLPPRPRPTPDAGLPSLALPRAEVNPSAIRSSRASASRPGMFGHHDAFHLARSGGGAKRVIRIPVSREKASAP